MQLQAENVVVDRPFTLSAFLIACRYGDGEGDTAEEN